MGSAYATVPMPAEVADLPMVGRMPVPAITEYEIGGEDPKWADLRAAGGPVLECRCELGTGKALIGKQCPVRQRKGMTGRLCNVCGQRIDGDAIFVGISLSGSVPGETGVVPVSQETPTHPLCLAYSALVCPAIGGENAMKCVLAIAPGEYPMFDRWIVRDPDRPNQAGEQFVPHGRPRLFLGQPIGCLDFVFARLNTPDMRFLFLAEWMAAVAPNPYRRLWRRQMAVPA